MRDLAVVEAGPAALIPALRGALDGSGPAVLPLAPGADPAAPAVVPQTVALVVRTSGSSGVPKSVALSAGALLAGAAATEGALGGPGGWALALPGHYIAGAQVIVRALASGTEPAVVAPGPFTAVGLAHAVSGMPDDRPRYTALVPTQLLRVVTALEDLDPAATPLRSLDAILIGGARLPQDLADRALRVGLRAVRTYGASETAGGCVYDGVPLAGTGVRVRDGEVQLSGPTLAEGYLDDPDRTAAAFLTEPGRRWYRTGDAGEWDGERLRVTGRLDDVIVSGGEKVSLGLVEQAVQALPGTEDAVVVRAADAEWGEVPVVVATRPVDLAALRRAVADRVGRAAAPSRVVVLDALPLLGSGKPDRVALARLAAGLAGAP